MMIKAVKIEQKLKGKKMKPYLKGLFSLVFSLLLWAIPAHADATRIWCNPENIAQEDGKTKATGYHDLWNAMAAMSPNDTLLVANGDWRKNERMRITADRMPPDGSNGGYSRITAETDWGVKLPHIRIETNKPHGFIEFRGFVFDNRFVKNGIAHFVYNMHHTKFIRCGFLAHGLKGNSHCMGFGNADYKDRSKNSYNLMEECIAWGSGRYMLISWNGEKTIFRRCLVRHDYNNGPQIFNFRAYACDQTIYQNCISIDSDRIKHYAKPLNIESGGFWVGDQYGANGNVVAGCISIKDIQLPYYISGNEGKGQSVIKNSIALDATVPGVPTLSAFVLKSNTNVIASNLLGVKALNKSQDGFYGKKGGTFAVTDSILRNIGNIGLRANQNSNINHYLAGQCVPAEQDKGLAKLKAMLFCWGAGSTDYDPFQNGLLYPVRIEHGSPLSTAGQNGGRCGPEILKKIGVSGTLYGEKGWDKITDENLWPFPNEEEIRELMRETVDGVTGIYGFCAEGRTLTNYIWAYLGKTVPPFNISAIPGDGVVTLKWDPPAEIAIDSITGFNVYKVVGETKTLIDGTLAGNTNCSKTISGLKNGSSYEFAVTAIDKVKGESGLSYKLQVIPGKSEKLSVKKSPLVMRVREGKDAEKVSTTTGNEFSNKFGMKFSLIQPGTFEMGFSSNDPNSNQHQVTLTKGFYIQKTEVTQEQWKSVMGKNPSFFKECGDNCPVEQVSWNDVQQFIKRLNQLEETKKYRLPTEAEWEYVCRAGTQTPFSFGECLTSQQANYNGDRPYLQCEKGLYRKKPISSKAFPANPWGLIGMHGNVWEWCQDFLGKYSDNSDTDPTGPPAGEFRVIRGGGWNSYAKACRSGNRSGINPSEHYANLGFRLVRDI